MLWLLDFPFARRRQISSRSCSDREKLRMPPQLRYIRGEGTARRDARFPPATKFPQLAKLLLLAVQGLRQSKVARQLNSLRRIITGELRIQLRCNPRQRFWINSTRTHAAFLFPVIATTFFACAGAIENHVRACSGVVSSR